MASALLVEVKGGEDSELGEEDRARCVEEHGTKPGVPGLGQ